MATVDFKKFSTLGFVVASLVLTSTIGHAQTFPTGTDWTPLTQGGTGTVITEPEGDSTGSRDVVGDATNPAT